MALTDATRLADFSSGVGTDGTLSANHINATGVVTATSFVGSGSGLTGVASTDNIITGTAATFTAGINVTGVVTATSFVGDGSELTGVSGFATALSSDQTSVLNKIFKTPQTLTVGTGVSVTIESDTTSGNVAFVRESVVHVGSGSTLHIDSSTAFHTNVLGVF
jgi:hypothetical protein|tara:strand:- start:215 stop:706 length:492 start_codon:yes stop_codon:yes gene_type:complete